MIKIISGWSNPGGSTTAHINLCNLFNNNAIPCEFYGPHDYHLKLCNGKKLEQLDVKEDDTVIVHFFQYHPCFDKANKRIYSCHEKELMPVSSFDYRKYDVIHYVSNTQKEWHKVDYPSFVSGNVLDPLEAHQKKQKAAGIIGSIDKNKQVHKSIERAVEDGHKLIYIFGNVTDHSYFAHQVYPVIEKHSMDVRIKQVGFATNKQVMYDLITDVYQDSISETWGYVHQECLLTGTKYHGNGITDNNFEQIDNNEILKRWKEVV